jgi:hypothetical protein
MRDNTAIDPYTGETFEKKRHNQRFKSIQTKNAFHNEKARLERLKTSPYIEPVLKNRKILIKIMGNKDELLVSKDYLLGRGLNIRHFTWYDQKTSTIEIFDFNLTTIDNSIKIKRRK